MERRVADLFAKLCRDDAASCGVLASQLRADAWAMRRILQAGKK